MIKQYFEIPGNPRGKARARTFYNPSIGKHQSRTPAKTVMYENLVKHCFQMNCKETYFDKEPLEISITAHYPIPKSTTKKNRQLMIERKLFPTKKPDADNIGKVICDALNGVAYGDDAQIVRMIVNKIYTDKEPKVHVYINKFQEGDQE